MDVVWMRARSLARRGWRATLLLALLAGLSAGVAIATLGAGRRTATAFDRLLAFADPGELLVNFCPPEIEEVTEEALFECLVYDPVDERDTIAALPEVDAAVRGAFRGVTVAPRGRPEASIPATSVVVADPGMQSVDGNQLVVDGRWYRDDAPDEIVVTERFRDRSGLAVGDEVDLAFWSPDELGSFGQAGEPYDGITAEARIVGVARGVLDLAAERDSIDEGEDLRIHAGPALAAATSEAAGFTAMLVEGRDDVTREDLEAAINQAFPDRLFQVSKAIGADEVVPIDESIAYEATATQALGGLIALAAVVFVGQAVARQSRRELTDGPALLAIGVTRRQIGAAAALRGLAIALPAIGIGVLAAVAMSPIGPIGVARRAEVDPGVRVDWTVLGLGGLAILLSVVGCATTPAMRSTTVLPTSAAPGRVRVLARSLPPSITAGLGLAQRGAGSSTLPLGTALSSVALAIATLVAGAGLTASLDSLFETPARFGAPWDLSVTTAVVRPEADAAILEHLASAPDVIAAAGIAGSDFEIGGTEIAWIHAFEPIEGVERAIPLPIVDGRAPGIGEIALGAITMDALGVNLGDTVPVRTLTTNETHDLVVVGVAVVNDNFEKSPGRGGVAPVEWMDSVAPEVSPDPYIVDLRPGADVGAFAVRLREDFAAVTTAPVPQEAIRNVDRIRDLPFLLAAVVSGLALASLFHALVLSVRRHRGQLAVLRSLGFTRRQVRIAVATHATSVAVVAAAVGIPLGVILGRWGWRVVAEQIGVPAFPVTPLGSLALALALTVAIANAAAALPAWRAARISAAEALRTE